MEFQQPVPRSLEHFNHGQSLLDLQAVQKVKIYSYSFPFKSPLHLGRQLLKKREGWLIELTDRDGFNGMGEIAPLPGYSIEAPELVLTQTRRVARQLRQHDPFEISALHYELKSDGLLPSISFGIETALHYLHINRLKGKKSDTPKVRRREKKIPVNALLVPGELNVAEQVSKILAKGFKTIKLKVGRQDLKDDINMVNHVTSILPEGIRLRLDANGLWSFQEALAFGRGVNNSFIEYIEEPFTHTEYLTEFYEETGIPCAMDESLRVIDLKNPKIFHGVRGFVLKPTILGGIGQTMAFIQLAKAHSIKPIISSCFECGPGFALLMKIAAGIDFDDSASGLDTLRYLEKDLFVNPIEIREGVISLDTQLRLDSPGIFNMQAVTSL
jgi:O-succinylbenzoate synthase